MFQITRSPLECTKVKKKIFSLGPISCKPGPENKNSSNRRGSRVRGRRSEVIYGKHEHLRQKQIKRGGAKPTKMICRHFPECMYI